MYVCMHVYIYIWLVVKQPSEKYESLRQLGPDDIPNKNPLRYG